MRRREEKRETKRKITTRILNNTGIRRKEK